MGGTMPFRILGSFMMLRHAIAVLLLVGAVGTVLARDIQVVQSWTHYRQLLEADGLSRADADARISRMLGNLGSMDRAAGNDRIGVTAPPFQFDSWLNSEPMNLEDLRGQVVLVRWWTDTCPFCASSAPALRAIHETYGPRGLTLVGVFHPKAGRDDPLDVERVQRAVDARHFEFPVAIDWDWRNGTLEQWWLTGPDRPATSVTFLVDKAGVIRFIHPGMEYHDATGPEGHPMCVDDMAAIRDTIERLLAEPGPASVAAHP
jgi:peroxiredoxin